jgi:phosphomannomutase
VNVVEKMKEVQAVIGGEGNGGIIYPTLHYGRDSLVGIALFLTFLARERVAVSALRGRYRAYYMSKKKIELHKGLDVDGLLKAMEKRYLAEDISTVDGVKIDFADNWVHLRKSNTEPIIRIYTEASSQEEADELADKFIAEIQEVVKEI